MTQNYWQQGIFPSVGPGPITTSWSGSDSEENFNKNKPAGWTKTSVTYSYNSYGFRTDEFKAGPNMICLGCSFTEGTGVNINDTWPSVLQPHFPEHKIYNLGIHGGSPDTVTRILTNVSSILNPAAVFILWPEISRFEFYKDNNQIHFCGAWSMTKATEFLYNDSQALNNYAKNKLIVNSLKTIHGFKLVEWSTSAFLESILNRPFFPPARDGEHPGIEAHQFIANTFLQKYHQ